MKDKCQYKEHSTPPTTPIILTISKINVVKTEAFRVCRLPQKVGTPYFTGNLGFVNSPLMDLLAIPTL